MVILRTAVILSRFSRAHIYTLYTVCVYLLKNNIIFIFYGFDGKLLNKINRCKCKTKEKTWPNSRLDHKYMSYYNNNIMLLQLQGSGSREFDYLEWILVLQWLTLLKVGTHRHRTETPSEAVVWRSQDLMSMRLSSTACQNSADNLICSSISKRNKNRKTLELVAKNPQITILYIIYYYIFYDYIIL